MSKNHERNILQGCFFTSEEIFCRKAPPFLVQTHTRMQMTIGGCVWTSRVHAMSDPEHVCMQCAHVCSHFAHEHTCHVSAHTCVCACGGISLRILGNSQACVVSRHRPCVAVGSGKFRAGKSSFAVESTRNTGFILVLLSYFPQEQL